MRAVPIARFGGPELLEIVDVPEPEADPNQPPPARIHGQEIRHHR